MSQLNELLESNSSSQPANSSAGAPQSQQQQQTVTLPQDDKPLSLAELFASDSDEGESPTADDPSKPVDSLDGLVKRLNAKHEDVYNIRVPMPDGAEPLTIGQLKDRVGEVVKLEQETLRFDQRRIKQEGELLQAQAEIRDLISLLPKDAVKPALIEKVRTQHAQMITRERQATLEAIPAWEHEQTRLADIKGMVDLLKVYGLPESFLGTVHDHRALKFIRDMYQMKTRIDKALANVKPDSKPGKRPSSRVPSTGKPNSSAPSTRRSGAVPTQNQRIEQLFRS
jgi:hypothetical protein